MESAGSDTEEFKEEAYPASVRITRDGSCAVLCHKKDRE